jgi:23S rRNA-/tRNA-specific pseudouridylate synthase
MTNIPEQPANSFRIAITLDAPEERIDNVLLNALREQNENDRLKTISRTALKDLFNEKKIMIKGQRAKSSSSLAKGTTYVDILGF